MADRAAALGPALAAATRAAHTPVVSQCQDELRRQDEAVDAALQAQSPALEALAQHMERSRTSVAQIQRQLEGFAAQLEHASRNISQWQARSSALTERLESERAGADELAAWLADVVVPPATVQVLRDTAVADDVAAWVQAVHTVERCTKALSAYEATQTAAAVGGTARAQAVAVADACKQLVRERLTQAASKIYPHLLHLLQPIKTSVTTTLPILQFSVLLPHNQPLYAFLARHTPRLAAEVQLAYVNAVRVYYETAFRRYVRELKKLLQRWAEPCARVADARLAYTPFGHARLQFAQPTAGAAAIMAYQSEDAQYQPCPEHVFHSLALVLVDTACSEYAFLTRFFAGVGMPEDGRALGALPATGLLSLSAAEAASPQAHLMQETWRQVMEPAMAAMAELREARHALPHVPLLSWLTTAHLTHELMRVADTRRCLVPELESAFMQTTLEVWPLVAKALDAEVDALKHLGVGTTGTAPARTSLLDYWGSSLTGTDLAKGDASEALARIATAYTDTFAGVTRLADAEQQGMLHAGYVVPLIPASSACAPSCTACCRSTPRGRRSRGSARPRPCVSSSSAPCRRPATTTRFTPPSARRGRSSGTSSSALRAYILYGTRRSACRGPAQRRRRACWPSTHARRRPGARPAAAPRRRPQRPKAR